MRSEKNKGKQSDVNAAYDGLARIVRAIEEEKYFQVWFKELAKKSEALRRIEIERSLSQLNSLSGGQTDIVKCLRLLEDPRVFGAVEKILRQDGYVG